MQDVGWVGATAQISCVDYDARRLAAQQRTSPRPEGIVFENPETFKMNGLRVYFNPVGTDTTEEQRLFYSRRAGGPYYCWLYVEALGQWRCSRVHLPDLMLKALSVANWKAVPTALQTKLGEHYLE